MSTAAEELLKQLNLGDLLAAKVAALMVGMRRIQDIFKDIGRIRLEQIQEYGDRSVDDLHDAEKWYQLLSKQANFYVQGNEPRRRLLHIAATAIAAIEALDRNVEAQQQLAEDQIKNQS